VSGLAAPFWVPGFRSHFVGEGDAAAQAVAVVESVVFLACTILEEMGLDSIAPPGSSRAAASRTSTACALGSPRSPTSPSTAPPSPKPPPAASPGSSRARRSRGRNRRSRNASPRRRTRAWRAGTGGGATSWTGPP
jgi:hypothetical protein